MPDMAEKYGVDTSNTFAALEDDVEKGDKTEDKKKEAPARKKVEKKDKEKHGKSAGKSAPPAAEARAKKHEFDRRPGPGPQRKVDKRTSTGKFDTRINAETQAYEDAQIAKDHADDEAEKVEVLPGQDAPSDSKDGKDSKDKKDEKTYLDLDEYRAEQQKKRPKEDNRQPRAPKEADGDFREAKEFVKAKEENLKIELPKVEVKEKKKLLNPSNNNRKGRAKERKRQKKSKKLHLKRSLRKFVFLWVNFIPKPKIFQRPKNTKNTKETKAEVDPLSSFLMLLKRLINRKVPLLPPLVMITPITPLLEKVEKIEVEVEAVAVAVVVVVVVAVAVALALVLEIPEVVADSVVVVASAVGPVVVVEEAVVVVAVEAVEVAVEMEPPTISMTSSNIQSSVLRGSAVDRNIRVSLFYLFPALKM